MRYRLRTLLILASLALIALGMAAAQAAVSYKANHPETPIFVLGLCSAVVSWAGIAGVLAAIFGWRTAS